MWAPAANDARFNLVGASLAQFLALSASLPELAASIAALRLGAPELAITNVLGSNLFNMGFALFLDDIAYADGALWYGISLRKVPLAPIFIHPYH